MRFFKGYFLYIRACFISNLLSLVNRPISKMNIKKEIWLLISGFGIMFAVLSWLQEASIMSTELGWIKGLYALITGFILFIFFRKSL